MRTSELGLKVALRELCKKDFLVFQKVELGYEIGSQHHIWNSHLKDKDDVIEMAPRDHGKSHSVIRAYALWRAKYDPWIKEILILGPDQPSAVENLDKIRELLMTKATLEDLIPMGRSHGPDSRTEMKLGNRKVIKAKGWGSPLRGRHPQLILMDDVANEANSWSSEARKDMKTRFNEVVVPMKDKGTLRERKLGFKSQIVVVGTAQDQEDLYHDLLKNPEFIGTRLEAIVDEELKIPLWPERYSYEDLMRIKRLVGTLAFSKEYMNRPMSDETTIFPTSLFEPCFDRERSYARNYLGNNPVYLGVDFSVPGSTDGDWTVVIAIEYNPTDHSYTILNYWRDRPQFIRRQLEQIEYYCQTYRVTMGFLEDNMFQGIYREHFRTKSNLPLQGHTVTGQNKRSMETGILSLRPMLENQKILFPYRTEEDQSKTDYLVTEFNGIRQRQGKIGNETSHDDGVLALWHAICASRGSVFEADFG